MKSILITGAAGGMGRAAAEHFSAAGYRVFALDLCESSVGENIVSIEADITSETSVKKAFEAVSQEADSLFAIIHFAGIYMLDSLVEMSDVAFSKIVDVNLKGAFLVNRTFFPLLHKDSRVLITTSELAPLDPLPFTGLYAVTKAALDKYAYSLAMELQLLGVRVSVLRAGAVDTGMLGVSTTALDKFCDKTEIYKCNASRFKKIVSSVEARCVSPTKIAKKCERILKKRSPRFAYYINRNPLLLLLNVLPKRLQLFAIKIVLK